MPRSAPDTQAKVKPSPQPVTSTSCCAKFPLPAPPITTPSFAPSNPTKPRTSPWTANRSPHPPLSPPLRPRLPRQPRNPELSTVGAAFSGPHQDTLSRDHSFCPKILLTFHRSLGTILNRKKCEISSTAAACLPPFLFVSVPPSLV